MLGGFIEGALLILVMPASMLLGLRDMAEVPAEHHINSSLCRSVGEKGERF